MQGCGGSQWRWIPHDPSSGSCGDRNSHLAGWAMGNAAGAGCHICGAGGQGPTCQQGARPPIPRPELPWIRNTSWVEAAAPCATKGSPPTLPPPAQAWLSCKGCWESCNPASCPFSFCTYVYGAGGGELKKPRYPCKSVTAVTNLLVRQQGPEVGVGGPGLRALGF